MVCAKSAGQNYFKHIKEIFGQRCKQVKVKVKLCFIFLNLFLLLKVFWFVNRHSIEYIDRDEMIIGHMVDGVDAFIKPSQGWPISTSPLKLLSLKGSTQSSKEVTFSFLCKVEVSHALI